MAVDVSLSRCGCAFVFLELGFVLDVHCVVSGITSSGSGSRLWRKCTKKNWREPMEGKLSGQTTFNLEYKKLVSCVLLVVGFGLHLRSSSSILLSILSMNFETVDFVSFNVDMAPSMLGR